ncbi:hypothetical protein FLA_4375 [Filimonas lacunae]|nr:hypothetical protein FLA_4375 [Filimonas lacunae]
MQQADTATEVKTFISSENLLNEWIGHRRLTRRVIEAFPEDQLFTFQIGGMRTFGAMVKELLDIGATGVKGMVTNDWGTTDFNNHHMTDEQKTKEYLLQQWDLSTEAIIHWFPQISEERFQETVKSFGQYEGHVYSSLLYFIDNEIHHRAQGFVYLRSLGVEPPAFWNRN